jgi:hypothetical protein
VPGAALGMASDFFEIGLKALMVTAQTSVAMTQRGNKHD